MTGKIRVDQKYNIKEEVYKCSKCGLCKSVCPVFLASKNEMFLSRGRYILLNGFYNFSKKFSHEFVKNLDVCLNCNACKNFCPSNIDAYKVFTDIKNKYNYKFSFFRFSFLYRLLLNLLRISRFLYCLVPFKCFFVNENGLFFERVKRVKRNTSLEIKGKVIYFEGCVNKYINPSDKNASLNLIEKCGYSVEKIISECCGYPYLSEGNFEKYKKQINKIEKLVQGDSDFIVCSCDTCFDTLKRAMDFLDVDKRFLSKLITIDDFFEINNYRPESCENPVYFKPLLRDSDCYFPFSVLQIEKKGLCSLMENFFMLKYSKLSEDIINTTFYTKDEIEGRTIITSCQLSKIGLIKCIERRKANTPVMSYAEYISKLK